MNPFGHLPSPEHMSFLPFGSFDASFCPAECQEPNLTGYLVDTSGSYPPLMEMHLNLSQPPSLEASCPLPAHAMGFDMENQESITLPLSCVGPMVGSRQKRLKASRERQLKINAASRRCRRRQRLELQFLRRHAVEMQDALRTSLQLLKSLSAASKTSLAPQIARLTSFLNESVGKVELMGSTMQTSGSNSGSMSSPMSCAAKGGDAKDEPIVASIMQEPGDRQVNQRTNNTSGLSETKRQALVEVARFIIQNVVLENRVFSPDVISSLPIDIDGWKVRLAISEKCYTTHSSRFFPVDSQDLFNFCWEMNVPTTSNTSQVDCQYRRQKSQVTPLHGDAVLLDCIADGKWTQTVHGVARVRYKGILSRDQDGDSAIIGHQSVLDQKDLDDTNVVPILFKRWVRFQPHQSPEGVQGTLVEAFRTASYATGRWFYGANHYDSFCEYLICAYSGCNTLLESQMAKDQRFQKLFAINWQYRSAQSMLEADHRVVVKDLLLF